MLSLRFISIAAAAAFATITSAIPTAPPTPSDPSSAGGGVANARRFSVAQVGAGLGVKLAGGKTVAGGAIGAYGAILGSKLLSGGVKGGITRPAVAGAPPQAASADLVPTKRGPTSPGDIFKTCSDGVELVVVKIGQYHKYLYYFNI